MLIALHFAALLRQCILRLTPRRGPLAAHDPTNAHHVWTEDPTPWLRLRDNILK